MDVVMVCSTTELDSGISIYGSSSLLSASGPQSVSSSDFKNKSLRKRSSSLLFMSGNESVHSIVIKCRYWIRRY